MAHDAVVVGSGPNGLAAAIELARAGRSVLVREASDQIGGGMRSAELTLPGVVHDVCSAVHPLGIGSPFFRGLDLERFGLEWIQPVTPLAHPFDDGSAAVLERSVARTAEALGPDEAAYRGSIAPLVGGWERLTEMILGPPQLPRHPWLLASFGLMALRSADGFARSRFRTTAARALFAGNAAHSMLPLTWSASAAFGLVLTTSAHAVGWPFARRGSQSIADALARQLIELGGELATGAPVATLDELAGTPIAMLDVTPRQFLRLAGERLPARYRRRLERYRYGPGAFKIDWALSEPICWRSPACRRAGTLHLGGTLEEIAYSELAAWRGEHPDRPFVLLAQPSVFDDTRAPPGLHTAWAYCHVPHGSTVEMTGRIEAQVERFAPGFRDIIIARNISTPADLERRNANMVGGNINGGSQQLRQLLMRPTLSLTPYTTPLPGVFLCSAATPPGGGVHGMCGFFAARAALRRTG